jgi:hypothetical protein
MQDLQHSSHVCRGANVRNGTSRPHQMAAADRDSQGINDARQPYFCDRRSGFLLCDSLVGEVALIVRHRPERMHGITVGRREGNKGNERKCNRRRW